MESIKIGNFVFDLISENSYICEFKDFNMEAKKFIPGKEKIPFIDKLDVCYYLKTEESYIITGYDKIRNEYFGPFFDISSK